MASMSRRTLFILAGAAAASAGTLSACSGVGGGGAATGSLRYAMWGSSVREENYRAALEEFQEATPEITIDLEFAEYNAYLERMTTQMAARDVADIFWVPSPHVMTYAANELYRDLSTVDSLDLSDYSDSDIDALRLNGVHNTMALGIFVPVTRFNASFAEEDDVEIPDEWTWDSFADFAIDYSNNNANGRKATSYGPHADLPFEGWLRQHGEELWTEDGQIGFSLDGAASWIDYWEKLRTAGATTSVAEQDGVQPDWPTVGDKILTNFGNSNHILDDGAQFPDYVFGLRHMPVSESAADGYQYLYFPRISIYQNTSDENAELAGHVLNYGTGTVEMMETVGLTMGAPVNPRVAEEVVAIANDHEKEMLRIVAEDRAAQMRPRFDAPPGTSDWRSIMARSLEEITLGNMSVSDGAQTMIDEINRGIERAS